MDEVMEQPVPKPWPTMLDHESRWTESAPWCPRPNRWHATDDDSTEVEVTELVAGFVRALQPDLVVETGTAWGQTAEAIGRALLANGNGELESFEVDLDRVRASQQRCLGLPVHVRQVPSLSGLQVLAENGDQVGFAWLDSLFELRVPEMEAVVPLLAPQGGVIGVHDCGWKYPEFRSRVVNAAYELGLGMLELPTPRGVMFFSTTTHLGVR